MIIYWNETWGTPLSSLQRCAPRYSFKNRMFRGKQKKPRAGEKLVLKMCEGVKI
jgi:hypothetical protein